ncbi:hypothetical protein HZC07_05690 [Candidatus Micrarchaeota archaeon]|nr:hypothetical protein [Candidatus Micrarchaeota archaeon]
MKSLKIMIFFLMALLAVYGTATTVQGTWDYINPGQSFTTDLRFNTAFTTALLSGQQINSTAYCRGATIALTPSYTSTWAVSNLRISSPYPTCSSGGSYCPTMPSGGAANSNTNIEWLSSSAYNSAYNFGQNSFAADFSRQSTQNRYNELNGAFFTQPMNYNNGSGVYSNRQGGANIFCAGSMDVTDSGTLVGSTQMPSTNSVNIALNTPGQRTIQTNLGGVSCFGAVNTYPTSMQSNQDFFRIYYFTANGPGIGSAGPTTRIITVQNNSGVCSLSSVRVVAITLMNSAPAAGNDWIMANVLVQNTGPDTISVQTVSASNPSYSVTPAAVPLFCGFYGMSPCPSSNGFGEPIGAGATKSIYVLVSRPRITSSPTRLIFGAQTVSNVCGAPTTCSASTGNFNWNSPRGTSSSCSISTSSLQLGTREDALFTVTCRDLSGNPTACSGNNWFWTGVQGDFLSRTNSSADAYPTSSPGTSGTLNYQTGTVTCSSNINVVAPTYACSLSPTSATLNISESQYFTLSCTVSGSPATPTSAQYFILNGLLGTLSNSNVQGTNFTAGAVTSRGDLMAAGQLNQLGPILGAVTPLVPISVVNNTNNCPNGVLINGVCTQCTGGAIVNGACVCPNNSVLVNGVCTQCTGGTIVNGACICPTGSTLVNGSCSPTNCQNGSQAVNGNCVQCFGGNCAGGKEGSTEFCTIFGNGVPTIVYTGSLKQLYLKCGIYLNDSCDPNIVWSAPGIGTVSGGSTTGALVNVSAVFGTTGRIIVIDPTDRTGRRSCYLPVVVGQPACFELS